MCSEKQKLQVIQLICPLLFSLLHFLPVGEYSGSLVFSLLIIWLFYQRPTIGVVVLGAMDIIVHILDWLTKFVIYYIFPSLANSDSDLYKAICLLVFLSSSISLHYQHHLEMLQSATADLKIQKKEMTDLIEQMKEENSELKFFWMRENMIRENSSKDKMRAVKRMASLQDQLVRLQDQLASLQEQLVGLRGLISSELSSLECPVCLEVMSGEIFCCPRQHLICSSCSPGLGQCPVCRMEYRQPRTRHRYAESQAQLLRKLDQKLHTLETDFL